MSDISIPGIASKYNTPKLIEDLVKAEEIRLTRMEKQVVDLEDNRAIWRQINRDLGDLQRTVKTLYGFENPFSERSAISSDEGILEASAARTAFLDSYALTVEKLATSDRFLTTPLSKSFRVDEGVYTISVAEESFTLHYRGGNLDDFTRRLTEKGEGIARASSVRNTADTRILLIEAIPTGASNRIQFHDDARDFAIKTGMMRHTKTHEGGVTLENLKGNLQTISRAPVDLQSIKIHDDSIVIQPASSLRIPLDNAIVIEDGMVLEFSYRTIEISDENIGPPVPPGPKWPAVPSGVYKGITVRSRVQNFALPYSDERTIPERVDDWNIFMAEGKPNNQNLPASSQTDQFTSVRTDGSHLPAEMTALLMENNNTHRAVELKDVRLFDPSKPGDMEPVQPVSTADDAIINFHGIAVSRPTNTIDDLVDGLTLNLKNPSEKPVNIAVEPNIELAKDSIIRFVYSYNQLLTRLLVLTGSDEEVVDELSYLEDDQRMDMEEMLGKMKGDTTLNQIKNRLHSIVSNPYPTSAGADLRLLAQIGVSTSASRGVIEGSIDRSKLRGYLEIDEEKLDSFLPINISAVKDLFGNDTTGDLVINSGVAKALDNYIVSYTQTGGITGIRLDGIEGKIEDVQEKIVDYKEYLGDFEKKLKRQYGNMEAMLNQLENSSRGLENFSQQRREN